MPITTRSILNGYLECKTLAQKWTNILDSFWHKNEGQLVKEYNKDVGTITLVDGTVLELGQKTSNAGKFTTAFTPTVTIEGVIANVEVPANTTFESYLKSMVVKYLPPTINSLTLDYSVNQPLVGQPVTVTNAVFSFGNDSDGNKPKNIAIEWNGKTDVISGTDVNKAYVDNDDDQITSFSLTKNTAGNLTFATLTAQDEEDNDLVRTTTKTFYNEFLFGASNTEITSQTTANTVLLQLTKTKRNSKSITLTTTADNNDNTKFTYIAYISSYGDLSGIIQDGAAPVLNAFTKIGDYTYNNGFINVTVRIYKSNAPGAFVTGTNLQTS